jgi:hypothetical protein
MPQNASTQSDPVPARTLAELCGEIAAVDWYDEPGSIPTSLGDFDLLLDLDTEFWVAHQKTRRQFDLYGIADLGFCELQLCATCPENMGAPSDWDAEWPSTGRPLVYSLCFADLEKALNLVDWSRQPKEIELAGVQWMCTYAGGEPKLWYDLGDNYWSGSLALIGLGSPA